MKRFKVIILIFFSFYLEASELISTDDFHRIEEEIEKLDEDSLVLFDVDWTLIVPDDPILRPMGKSFFHQLTEGYDFRVIFREILFQASHSLVDPRSVILVRKLQENGIPTLAFTAASGKVKNREQIGDWRVEELERYGFHFEDPISDGSILELSDHSDPRSEPIYKSGILFSAFHPKGEILDLFLERTGWNPKKVIFVDDQLLCVESVIASLEKKGIDCVGIHYTATWEDPSLLNQELARFQVNYFFEKKIWLGEKEARELLYLSSISASE